MEGIADPLLLFGYIFMILSRFVTKRCSQVTDVTFQAKNTNYDVQTVFRFFSTPVLPQGYKCAL